MLTFDSELTWNAFFLPCHIISHTHINSNVIQCGIPYPQSPGVFHVDPARRLYRVPILHPANSCVRLSSRRSTRDGGFSTERHVERRRRIFAKLIANH